MFVLWLETRVSIPSSSEVREKELGWSEIEGGEVVVEALRSRFEIAAKRRGSEVARRWRVGERKLASACLVNDTENEPIVDCVETKGQLEVDHEIGR